MNKVSGLADGTANLAKQSTPCLIDSPISKTRLELTAYLAERCAPRLIDSTINKQSRSQGHFDGTLMLLPVWMVFPAHA
jgi:hypothetical protein